MKEKIINISGWMYDEKEFPLDKCCYVVASSKEAISVKLTEKELTRFERFCYVHDTHFFREFEMPKFPVLFIPDWKRHMKSRVIDYDMVTWAVKNSVKIIGYKGSNEGDYVDIIENASTQKELKIHGIIDAEHPLDTIMHHPEALRNQTQFLNPDKNY